MVPRVVPSESGRVLLFLSDLPDEDPLVLDPDEAEDLARDILLVVAELKEEIPWGGPLK